MASYERGDMPAIRNKLRVLPKSAGAGESYSSVGEKRSDYKQPLGVINDKVRLFSLKEWLLDSARDKLLDGFKPEIIQELIKDSPEF